MNLEDILIDYIAVFPDGNLNYLAHFVKLKSNNDLIDFIRIIEVDFYCNKGFYNSIYMQKFLWVMKNEYEKRMPNIIEKSNKQLSSNAEEFVPSNSFNS
jgi:hypothetical protein